MLPSISLVGIAGRRGPWAAMAGSRRSGGMIDEREVREEARCIDVRMGLVALSFARASGRSIRAALCVLSGS
jgi:hypothetical protein